MRPHQAVTRRRAIGLAGAAGVPVTLRFVVVRADGECAPVSGAQVDVWHANASGLYSDEAANGTSGHKYLRGYQVTDDDGAATFVTVLPDEDDSVGLTLKHRRFHRTDSGRRVLRLTVAADEQVALRARVTRSGHRLARKRWSSVTTGTHKLNLPIPNRVRGGTARLTLLVTDQSGNTKTIHRTLRVPAR